MRANPKKDEAAAPRAGIGAIVVALLLLGLACSAPREQPAPSASAPPSQAAPSSTANATARPPSPPVEAVLTTLAEMHAAGPPNDEVDFAKRFGSPKWLVVSGELSGTTKDEDRLDLFLVTDAGKTGAAAPRDAMQAQQFARLEKGARVSLRCHGASWAPIPKGSREGTLVLEGCEVLP